MMKWVTVEDFSNKPELFEKTLIPKPSVLIGGKESACHVGDLGPISGLGRSPGEGKGYPLQYSGLENSMDCIVQGVTTSRTRLSDFHFQCANWLITKEGSFQKSGTSRFSLPDDNQCPLSQQAPTQTYYLWFMFFPLILFLIMLPDFYGTSQVPRSRSQAEGPYLSYLDYTQNVGF